ncbi:MAG TPA: DUF4450 domain-containing protein, partial [Opitutus sp.]|nr:DUF4450 domain-containing protein [Opitutus sp.]
MPLPHFAIGALLALLAAGPTSAQTFGASRLTPNLRDNIDRPLRYSPDGQDFVTQNGPEFFNRPLYGGNTGFRVDGGDRPEFVLYLPGRGGNLRLILRSPAGAKWLHDAEQIETRYRPGFLLYQIRDPLLGDGTLKLAVTALAETEALILRAEVENAPADLEFAWAFGGVNGERGRRDGDIGTENVPISEWFQLRPEFCRDNTIELAEASLTVRAPVAALAVVSSPASRLTVGDARQWNDLTHLLADNTNGAAANTPVAIGRTALGREPFFLCVQRLPTAASDAQELDTYRAVKAAHVSGEQRTTALRLLPAFAANELPKVFAAADAHFAALRSRVSVRTPDPFLDAAVGALNVAADAVWDEPQQAIMHGAIAWRTKLLGWRGPYLLDALGWHDRARQHFRDWARGQNVEPISAEIPPPDDAANLARNEAGLHSNGDLSGSHYDMNLVYIDALFRHLRWTGDMKLAEELWPVIERHLAWERRLFRREFGPEKLPLYEAYAAIWASDDLQYHGGGTMHASAYNYFHHREAARLANALGRDGAPYEREAELLARGMRELLWLPDRGWFAEYKDLLGLQRVHPSAALWTFYHAMDSEVPTPREAWSMTKQIDRHIPHLPIRGPGVPEGLYTLATTNWMPYRWSINNVVFAEVAHTALGFWQAGRSDDAWSMTKGSLLAAMFMGITPGNVGSMSYLDAYRRESQRDFADGSGVFSRALVEGLFGVRPDVLGGTLLLAPGWPADWNHASLHHPDFDWAFSRTENTDRYQLSHRFARPLSGRLSIPRRHADVTVLVNGEAAQVRPLDHAFAPMLEIPLPAAAELDVRVAWAGAAVRPAEAREEPIAPAGPQPDGLLRWSRRLGEALEPVDLTAFFNDRVTQIFQNEYRAP